MTDEKKPDVFPIDIGSIKKGDYISPEFISEKYGIDTDDPHYWVKLLAMRQYIEQQSVAEFRPLLTKGEKRGIRILTDEEAGSYIDGLADQGVSCVMRQLGRLNRVDASSLSEQKKDELNRAILKNSKRVIAIKKSDLEVKALPSIISDTPSMFGE